MSEIHFHTHPTELTTATFPVFEDGKVRMRARQVERSPFIRSHPPSGLPPFTVNALSPSIHPPDQAIPLASLV